MRPGRPQPTPLREGSSVEMTASCSGEAPRASHTQVLESHGRPERREREGTTGDSHRCSTTNDGVSSQQIYPKSKVS